MKTLLFGGNSSLRRFMRCGCALLSVALTQCDLAKYFGEPCSSDDVPCISGSLGDGSVIDVPTVPDLTTPGPNTPIGPARKFEWRASIPLDASKMKFVGMWGAMPVFWAKDGTSSSRWVVYQAALLETDPGARIQSGTVPTTDFPAVDKIKSLDFANTELFLANKTFVKMQPGSPSITYLDSGSEIMKDATITTPLRIFRDTGADRFAVSLKPTVSGASAVLLRWDAASVTTFQSSDVAPTALVMGDLDATDPSKNGAEALIFEGIEVKQVQHQGAGSAPYPDDLLKQGIAFALGRLGAGTPVAAGCIKDLNGDGWMDLVLARGSSLYVTSYVGRDGQGQGQFKDWDSKSVASVTDPTIRSVSAVQLAGDSAPELVVETDKAVHFFLNKP